MLQALKDHWQDLKRGRPGHRFQDHYRNRHESGGHGLRKALFIGAGALIVAAGIFFLPAPGPGFLIIFLGGGLMAQESLAAARVLDWLELRVRAVANWALRNWQQASTPARAAIALFGLIVVGGAGYAAYQIFLAK
ncbi:MAG TPA: PGPGW domain-containing protein [Longimicrobiales bacterium]|nr:PGPGW domain-containing protein [Longimicrobiales bacterium]